MEPIGQKVLITSTEDIAVGSEFEENSINKFETGIFDETLDGALAKMGVEEDLLDDFTKMENHSDFFESEDFTNTQLNSQMEASKISSRKVSEPDIAIDDMEEIILTEELSIENNKLVQNTENFVSKISDSEEIGIRIDARSKDNNEENVEKVKKNEATEDKKNDSPVNQLQAFFHSTHSSEENSDLSLDPAEDKTHTYNRKKLDSEESTSKLSIAVPFEFDSLNIESGSPAKNEGESSEKIISNEILNSNNEFNLQKLNTDLKEVSQEDGSPKNSVEKKIDINITEKIQVEGSERFLEDKSPELKLKEETNKELLTDIPINGIFDKKSDFKNDDFEISEKMNPINYGLDEISKNFANSKSLDTPAMDENISIYRNYNLTDEKSPPKSLLIEDVLSEKEILEVSENQKFKSQDLESDLQSKSYQNIVKDEPIIKEMPFQPLKGTKKLKFANEQKTVAKEKINESGENLAVDNEISEGQNLLQNKKFGKDAFELTKEFLVKDSQKIVMNENANEYVHSLDNAKNSLDQKFVLKESEIFEPNMKERSFDVDSQIREQTKDYSFIKSTEKDNVKELSEKITMESLSNNRILSSRESEFLTNTKYLNESNSPAVFNSIIDNSNVSGIKLNESSNTMTDSLRNFDLPFDVEKVLSRVRILSGNGVEEMTLRLKPEELGQITLKIRQSGTELTIDMRVDNPQVKQLIESGFDTLRNRFLNSEFSYQDLALSVDINEKDSQFGRDRRNSEFEEKMSSLAGNEEQDNSENEEKVSPRISKDSMLNLYV